MGGVGRAVWWVWFEWGWRWGEVRGDGGWGGGVGRGRQRKEKKTAKKGGRGAEQKLTRREGMGPGAGDRQETKATRQKER